MERFDQDEYIKKYKSEKYQKLTICTLKKELVKAFKEKCRLLNISQTECIRQLIIKWLAEGE